RPDPASGDEAERRREAGRAGHAAERRQGDRGRSAGGVTLAFPLPACGEGGEQRRCEPGEGESHCGISPSPAPPSLCPGGSTSPRERGEVERSSPHRRGHYFATTRPSTPVRAVPMRRRYSTTSFTISGASLSGVMRRALAN